MVSEKYIMRIVKDYAKSPAGKAAIKETYGVEYSETLPRMKIKASSLEMKRILYSYIKAVIRSVSEDDIIIGEPFVNEVGRVCVKVSLREERMRRASLYDDKYDGIDNIILLFSHGYSARDHVYGWWGGNYVRSRRTREPNSFLDDAVSEFNNKYTDFAFAVLDDKYK